jgi:hypothetical protein
MAYHARGGKSFYLVEQASSSDLYLFGGDRGAELMDQGLVCGGSRFEDLDSRPCALCFSDLAPCALRLAPFSFSMWKKKECQVDLTTWRVVLGRS